MILLKLIEEIVKEIESQDIQRYIFVKETKLTGS